MKKIVVRMRKYINRISVLVTVFAVLMTASFYNPASLAADAPLTFHNGYFLCQGKVISDREKDDINWISLNIAPISYGTSGSYSFRSYSFSVRYDCYWRSDATNFSFDSDGNSILDGTIDFYVRSYMQEGSSSTLSLSGVSAFAPDGSSLPSPIWSTSDYLYGNKYSGLDSLIEIVFPSISLSKSQYYYFSLVLDYDVSVYDWSGSSGLFYSTFYHAPDFYLISTAGSVSGSLNNLTYGYNASAGNASQSKLDSSLSGQEAKEDSLFTSASDNLSKFSLTDLSSMPKVVAGLAFVSSTMTSIFEALGGVNGAGIVLSVGCSILFVSFCIGAYKFYSGRKD